jgi:hypothetical protein
MAPPTIIERLDYARIKRAATHPAIAARCPRCQRQPASLHRIVFKDSDQSHSLCWAILEILQDLEGPAAPKQLFKTM